MVTIDTQTREETSMAVLDKLSDDGMGRYQYVWQSLGGKKMREFYSDQYEQGYRFETNLPLNSFQDVIETLKARGLELFIGTKSFDIMGLEYPGMRVILTRTKRE
jgi:phosphoglycolate phosphatase-like HAD superfamily hydrolase